MWLLTHLHTGDKLYLIPKVNKYTVGRVGSDIALKDDSSISRSHAILSYSDASLQLEDSGSKYGTYHNENITNKVRVAKSSPIEIKEGDHILFGVLKNEWIASKINISAMTSALTSSQTTETQVYLKSVGGKLISKWDPSCTHLTMSEITITIKVLHALIEKIPIVSCEFWKDYLENVKEQKPPPSASKYLPKSSPLLSAAITAKNFEFNEKRRTLFAGKTFVFMSKKHYDLYSQIIEKAGGVCRDLKSNTHKSFLLQKNVIIIQYVPSTQSQGSQTVNNISEFLQTHSIRTVPEYEIGLAIVCCTIEKYCNPAYNPISHVLPNTLVKTPNIGTILVENTHSQKSEMDTSEPEVVEIADSDFQFSTPMQSNDLQSEVCQENNSEMEPVSSASAGLKKLSHASEMVASKNDTPSASVVSNSNGNNHEDTCKKRKKSNIEEESSAKKFHLSQKEEVGDALVESISSSSHSKTTLPPKSKSNRFKTNEPSFKTKTATKQPKSGFLQKSQLAPLDKTVNESIPVISKRGRIACITDEDDNGEDIFNFGSPAKKCKTTNYNSDEELFDFGNKGPNDIEDTENKASEDALEATQPFIVQNNNKTQGLTKIKISPVRPSVEGWLSKLNSLKIKSDLDKSAKNEVKEETDDPSKNEWINSIKDAFEVRIRKMNLTTKGNISSRLTLSSNGNLNTTKKNFKAFVKKNNYKPQTLVIQTSRR